MGRNINYYLMDDIPSGRIMCTMLNWTGVVYRLPRSEIVSHTRMQTGIVYNYNPFE